MNSTRDIRGVTKLTSFRTRAEGTGVRAALCQFRSTFVKHFYPADPT